MHINAQTPASFSPAPTGTCVNAICGWASSDWSCRGRGRGGTEGLTMRRQTTVASVTSWGRTQPQPGRGRPSGPRGQGASSPGLPCVDSRQPPSQRYTAVSANMSPPSHSFTALSQSEYTIHVSNRSENTPWWVYNSWQPLKKSVWVQSTKPEQAERRSETLSADWLVTFSFQNRNIKS